MTLDVDSRMSFPEGLNNVQIIRPKSSSSGVEVTSMSERELKTLKAELKNLRQAIVDGFAVNGLEDIAPILSLLAFHKCDPTYKYPSFDFVSMLLCCYSVSFLFFDQNVILKFSLVISLVFTRIRI